MNIVGNEIKEHVADNEYSFSSVKNFLENKKFTYLNIIHKKNDKYIIYYILAKKEDEVTI
jgi:hypothetical protein